MINKIFIGLTSLIKVLRAQIVTRKRISITCVNSIKGRFRVEIKGNGKVKIGRFLMTRGPLYLKSVDGGNIIIGERVFFNHNCSITSSDEIYIGNHCMFANNLVIVDHDHIVNSDGVSGELISQPVVIEDDVWCGANVTITKGVHIGKGAVIGAGAVVTTDIPSKSIVGGVPAKRIK